MKKSILFIAMIALTLTMAACGDNNNNGGSGSAAEATNESSAEDLKLVATNWAFDQEEYVIEAGQPINFSLENAEGHHTYEIKGLGIDIEEGKDQQYKINEPGEYDIVCSTWCGAGHDDMTAKLIVE